MVYVGRVPNRWATSLAMLCCRPGVLGDKRASVIVRTTQTWQTSCLLIPFLGRPVIRPNCGTAAESREVIPLTGPSERPEKSYQFSE
jgi:hypothetical protein